MVQTAIFLWALSYQDHPEAVLLELKILRQGFLKITQTRNSRSHLSVVRVRGRTL